MADPEATPIQGTDNAVSPIFSPDGASVAFLSQTPEGLSLRKINLAGGPVQALCTNYDNYLGSWSADGTIFFSNSYPGGLSRVSSIGGDCQNITTPDQSQGEVGHAGPEALPGGASLLFNVFKGFSSAQADIALLSLKDRKWQTLIHDGANPRYVPAGYVAFVRAGSLMAVPFDLSSLKVTRSPVLVLEDVKSGGQAGTAQLSIALDGTMAYIAGHTGEASRKVMLVDRNGKSRELTRTDGAYEDLDLSPDGRRLAMTIEAAAWNIWIYDMARGTLTRFTFENDNRDPIWSRDGKYLVYESFRNGMYGIYRKPADGSGPEEQLVSGPNWMVAYSFSPEDKELAYTIEAAETGSDIWILPLEGARKPRPFAQSRFNEFCPTFSPDGHWLAYESNESGRYEVYVQQYPGPGGKSQISNDGGRAPVWSNDGHELYYRNANKVIAVSIETKPAFTPGTPQTIFEGDYFQSGHYFDVMPGGKQFLFIKENNQPQASTEINIVLNWFDELKRLMGAQRPGP